MAHKTAFLEKKILNTLLRRLTTTVNAGNASTSNILVTLATGFDIGDIIKMTTAGTFHEVTAVPDSTHVTISPAMGAAPTTGSLERHAYRPSQVWIAAFTAAPSDAGGGTETAGGGYGRVQVTQADGSWAAPAGTPTATENSAEIAFPTSSGSQSAGANQTHFAVMDASAGGNMLAWAAFGTPQAVGAAGITVKFAIGALDWSDD